MEIIEEKDGKLVITGFDEIGAYKIARKVEKDGIHFYKKLSETSSDDRTRSLLQKIPVLCNSNTFTIAGGILFGFKARGTNIAVTMRATSNAEAGQKTPSPSGRHVFGRFLRCSSVTQNHCAPSSRLEIASNPCLRL